MKALVSALPSRKETKQQQSLEIAAQVAEFLARGGKIAQHRQGETGENDLTIDSIRTQMELKRQRAQKSNAAKRLAYRPKDSPHRNPS